MLRPPVAASFFLSAITLTTGICLIFCGLLDIIRHTYRIREVFFLRVIIIGAGKVGYKLAEKLSQENHEVLIIEQNEDRRKILQENLDVLDWAREKQRAMRAHNRNA